MRTWINVPARRVRKYMRACVHARVTRRTRWSYRKSQIPLTSLAIYQGKTRQGDVALRAFRRPFLCGATPDSNLFLPHARRICIRDRNAYTPTVCAKNVRGSVYVTFYAEIITRFLWGTTRAFVSRITEIHASKAYNDSYKTKVNAITQLGDCEKRA